MHLPNDTLAGTIGGTLLSIAATINSEDIAKTIILASAGATVSFFVSLLLKCLIRKHKK